MMKTKYGHKIVWGVALATTLLANAHGAHAYGPEGMFGGRLNPDSTIVLDTPVQIEDRPERAQSVLQHPRPDYDPVPVSIGSFDFFPSVEAGYAYDSNIYAQHDNKTSDNVATLRPTISAFSNWSRHALAMTTFGDLNFFTGEPDENVMNFATEVQGRYDVAPETWIAGRAGYQHLAEPRTSPDSVNGDEPTTFDVGKTGVSAYRGLGKVKVGADYDVTRYFYNDTPSATGMIDQSTRDRTKHEISSRVGYDLTENVKPYVRAGYNWRVYDHNDERTSEGYDVAVGTTADFGGITSADVYVGWMSQDYDHSAFGHTNDGVKFGGRLEWNVTGLTTVVLETSRTIEETTLADFNSYKATGGSATVTHELRRNILLEADLSFTRDDYVGTGDRTDDNLGVGGGVRWLINRYLYSDLVYNWDRRFSDDKTSDYARHIVSLRVGAQM